MSRIVREITPIAEDDFFIIMNHFNAKFDFPIHYHPEFELNIVLNSQGKRIIGDSIMDYGDNDMVLIGPNTPHAWTGDEENKDAHVITIQFQNDFLDEKTLNRKLVLPIRDLLVKARRGVWFPPEVTSTVYERVNSLCENQGFDSLLGFLSILYDLSISRDYKILATQSYVGHFDFSRSRRIAIANEYIQKNIHQNIKIKDVAELVNMSETAFSHFFKKRTQRPFTDYVTDLRVGFSARLLIETEKTISEICYESGFNNLSNFNRTFRKKKGCTPTEFRAQQKLITKY